MAWQDGITITVVKEDTDELIVSLVVDSETDIPFVVGVLASFISGLLVIKFLLEYLKKGSFKIFAIYRVILGIIIIGIYCYRI